MPGYAAVAILEAHAIRVDRAGSLTSSSTEHREAAAAVEDLRVVRSLASEQLHEQATRLRRLWAQTTFYLFDAESWR